jgi:hypothetical protein
MVIVPDLSAPMAQALAQYNEHLLQGGDVPVSEANHTPIGYVQTETGVYALCAEGVGSKSAITDDNPLEVDLFTPNGGWPFGVLKLNDTELIMLPTQREVPLEDFIRTFGARLEGNYYTWLRHFQTNKPMAAEAHG